MMMTSLKHHILISMFLLGMPTLSKPVSDRNPAWLLNSFISLSHNHPERFLKVSQKLFSKERVTTSSKNPQLAHEWQHRAAALNGLSEFFSKDLKIKNKSKHQKQARVLIQQALTDDPSLLVRDTAVETIGRIVRMDESSASKWKPTLEAAFVDPKNMVQGEGLFIRESILKVLREANLKPSLKTLKAAKADLNPQVGYMLRAWETNSFDSL